MDPTYTEESLRADLWEVDFEPEEIVACGKNTGAFGLLFAEKYMATGLATALDGIDPEEKVVRRGRKANRRGKKANGGGRKVGKAARRRKQSKGRKGKRAGKANNKRQGKKRQTKNRRD